MPYEGFWYRSRDFSYPGLYRPLTSSSSLSTLSFEALGQTPIIIFTSPPLASISNCLTAHLHFFTLWKMKLERFLHRYCFFLNFWPYLQIISAFVEKWATFCLRSTCVILKLNFRSFYAFLSLNLCSFIVQYMLKSRSIHAQALNSSSTQIQLTLNTLNLR